MRLVAHVLAVFHRSAETTVFELTPTWQASCLALEIALLTWTLAARIRASIAGAVELVAAGCHSDSVGFYFLGTDVTDKVGVGDDLPFWHLGLFDKENSAGAFDSFFRQAIATDAVRSSSAPFVAEAASPLGCIWAAEALFEGALVASIGRWSR
jgi:hypothetical protein